MNLFQKLFFKNKKISKKDLAIDISKYLFKIDSNGYKTSIQLRLVNEKASKSLTTTELDKFLNKIDFIDDVIRYELLIRFISEDVSKMNLIQIKIDLVNDSIIIKYENNENLSFILENVNLLKDKIFSMGFVSVVEEKLIKEEKSETISLGILGEYDLYNINYVSDNDDKEKYNKIKELFLKFNNKVDTINNELFYYIYSNLECVVGNIWEEDNFNVLFDISKLPLNFNELSSDEKHNILFKYNEKVDKNNIIDITNKEKSFWNINNIKNDILIKNIIIDEKFHKLKIEFCGILDMFNAYVEMDYQNDFVISNFDAS